MNITADAREIAEAGSSRSCLRPNTTRVPLSRTAPNTHNDPRRHPGYALRLVEARGFGLSQANSKNFQPKLLRSTVVLRWDGAPKNMEKETVLLTTNPDSDPFVAFDAYDDRSLIENICNREAKEKRFLDNHPKRSKAGVGVHTIFVFLCKSLIAGFRAYKSKSDEAEQHGQDNFIAHYRRELEARNRDKVIVFIDEHFGIFRNFEFALLAGVTVRERAIMGESVEAVLRRYGVPDSPTNPS